MSRSSEAVAKWRRAHPKEARAARQREHLLARYGISLADYEKMAREQDWRCVICKETSTRTLDVDHDHETGRVRGLLCSTCNRAIGMLGDSVSRLSAAISYLER